MNYLVAAVGDWNKKLFKEKSAKFSGNWAYVSSPKELTNKLLEGFSPRYIFFPHWRWLVPSEVYNQYECVCFHMTDVPYGRGGSPLQNLIVRGHKETLLTALQMQEGLDAGPVYLKKTLSLEGKAEAIYNRASQLVWNMIAELLVNEITPQPQQGELVEFKRRTPKQSQIPTDLTLEQIYDYIRMLDAPGYPKAFIALGEHHLIFDDAKLEDGSITARVKIVTPSKPTQQDLPNE